MLPTFVIGLREGLEAALIVGIIAAFLRKQRRSDLIRWVFVGVGTAVVLCVAAGVALHVLSKDLPVRQQEGMETVIGALAVVMVTYMVVWMKRNSRGLKGQLEGLAADAMNGSAGAGRAMIVMAFLAVLREGVETVVFLIAAFNQSSGGSGPAVGVVLGLLVAIGLGYGIYRGGVRINLSKFFRATGLVLVLVAAGIVVNALRTAHEAGWLDVGQGTTVDLSWLVQPGSVQASLLTGMLGLQTRPVLIEVIGWLVYLVPVGVYVAWPPGKGLARRTVSRLLLVTGAVLAVAAAVVAVVRPQAPADRPATGGDRVVALSAATVRADIGGTTVSLRSAGSTLRSGVALVVYRGTSPAAVPADLPRTASWSRVAALNGGSLPLGLTTTGSTSATLSYAASTSTTVWIDPATGRVVDAQRTTTVSATVRAPSGSVFPLSAPVRTRREALTRAEAAAALAAAESDHRTLDHRRELAALAWGLGAFGLVALLAGGALAVGRRRESADDSAVTTPTAATPLVKS